MPALFGDIVVDMGYITRTQLEEAVEIQKKGRAKLGQVMINLRMLNQNQVAQVLDYQQSEKGSGKLFGNCAVELSFVSTSDLAEAVHYQITSKGILGDILINLGYLTKEQRDEVIRQQLLS